MEYLNRSVFFVPVRFNNYTITRQMYLDDMRWSKYDSFLNEAAYFFPYILRIGKNSDLFSCFRYEKTESDSKMLYTYETWLKENKYEDCGSHPKLTEIRFTMFSTNIGFLEYHFVFPDNVNPKDFLSFAYWFKKAKPKPDWIEENKQSLFDFSQNIMPHDISCELFFTNIKDFKCECKCFHTVKMNRQTINEVNKTDYMHRLARSYDCLFPMILDSGNNDMLYFPYENDCWCGSPDGFANLVIEDEKDSFTNRYKYLQIENNYYFLYLLLLNQRFSLLNYLDDLSANAVNYKKNIDIISEKSMLFQALFSYRIISDDLLYQTIYSKMYEILEIDDLIKETENDEKLSATLLTKQNLRHEKNMNRLLLGISFLSLFSALVDASGFFDRFMSSSFISTISSLVAVLGIFVFFIIRIKHKS